MDRLHFMRGLEEALTGLVSDSEMAEILSDHEEFFEAGIAGGETEDQVARRLGDPAKIAVSLLRKDERQSPRQEPSKPDPYRRILAFVVDTLLASLPFMFLSPRGAIMAFFYPWIHGNLIPSLLSTIKGSSTGWIAHARFFWATGVVLAGPWLLLVSFLCLAVFRGQTAGKRLSGLRVVNKAGGRASVGQCFTREVLGKYGLNTLCGAVWLPLAFLPSIASLVWLFVSTDGMTAWDAMAGTRVRDARPVSRGD